MRAPSSRLMVWAVCSSGRSVTMKVELVERASTLVCTFTLPYLVWRAFGMASVNARSSSSLGRNTMERARSRRVSGRVADIRRPPGSMHLDLFGNSAI